MSAEPMSHLSEQSRVRTLAAVRERARNFVGTLVVLRGDGFLTDPLATHPRALVEGQRVARGTKLRLEHGQALLRLDDGSDVWLAEGAVLDLSEWEPESRTLRLPLGRLLALVAEEVAKPFRILTPAGEVRVTGTAFEASATEGILRVQVLHGSVRVESGGRALGVGRNVGAEVRQGTAPAAYKVARWESAFSDVSASRNNPHVAAALAAAETAIEQARRSTSALQQKGEPSMKKIALVVAVLVAAGLGIWKVTGGRDEVTEVGGLSPAISDVLAGNTGNDRLPPKVVIRMKDGSERTFDPSTVEGLQEALEAARAEGKLGEHVKIRERKPGDAPMAPPGVSAEKHAIVTREVDAGMEAVRDLISNGMSPEAAAAAVARGLQESVNKQLEAQGKPPVRINVMASEGGGRAGIIISAPGEEVEVQP